MKINVNTTDLASAFKFLKPMISKTYIPILYNVKFKTLVDSVELSATNLELGGICAIPAEITEPGEITISLAEMLAVLTKLGKDKSLPIETATDKVLFGNTYLASLPTDEFPQFIPVPVSYNVDNLSTYASSAIPFTGTIEIARKGNVCQDMNCVFLHLNTGALIYATDGKRLAKIMANETKYPTELKAIVPTSAIKAMQFFTGSIGIGKDDALISFTSESGWTLISRLIEGDYPDAEAVIAPMNRNTHRVIVSLSKLQTAYNILSPPKPKGNHVTCLTLRIDDKLTMSYESSDGDLKHIVSVSFDLDKTCEIPFAVKLNSAFFKSAIDLIIANDVEISTVMADEEFSLNPIDFNIPDGTLHIAGTSQRAIVMPMRK